MNHENQIEQNKRTGALRLYRRYLSILFRSKMQYKKSFFMLFAGSFLASFTIFLSVYFMFRRFPQVKGYTFQEVLLCYSIVLMSFSLAEIWARGLEAFPGMVRRGEFDRVMLRPRSLLLQILGTQCDIERFSRVLQALVILLYAVRTSSIPWTPLKIAAVFFMLTGGCVLFSGIFLIQAAMSFFFLDGLEFTNIFTFGLNEHGKYPVDIYGKGVLWVLTYIIPFALVQYYPLLYVLGRRQELWYAFLPFAAALFLIPGYLLWRVGVRHYKSSGS
nr:ABC-2 family transporter protein [uncultured Acetatifactor sp.]